MKRTSKAPVTPTRTPKVGGAKATYKRDVFEALHRSASALHKVGAMDAQTMRNFDVACITKPPM